MGILIQNLNIEELVKFLKTIKHFAFKPKWLHWRWYHVEPWLKIKNEKKWKPKILCVKQDFCPSALGSFSHVVACKNTSKDTRKINLQLILNKRFVMGSHGVGIWCALCCWKACEICTSLVQKKYIYLSTRYPNNKWPIFGLKEF